MSGPVVPAFRRSIHTTWMRPVASTAMSGAAKPGSPPAARAATRITTNVRDVHRAREEGSGDIATVSFPRAVRFRRGLLKENGLIIERGTHRSGKLEEPAPPSPGV